MSQPFVQAAEEFWTEWNQDNRCSAVCQNALNISKSADVVRKMFDNVQADDRVEILILGKGLTARAIDIGHMHVRPGDAKGFEVVKIRRVYICGPIDRTRHQIHGHIADTSTDFEHSISYVRPDDVCHPFVETRSPIESFKDFSALGVVRVDMARGAVMQDGP